MLNWFCAVGREIERMYDAMRYDALRCDAIAMAGCERTGVKAEGGGRGQWVGD